MPGLGELFVRDSGGDGPPVLLLHGWMFASDLNWFRTYAPLADAGYRVLALDHRGHGRGLRPDEPFRLASCASDAAALVRTLGCGPVIAVGYSMGGPIASLMARDHPDTVRALVLSATSRDWTEPRMKALWNSMGILRLVLNLFPRQSWRWGLRRAGFPDSPTTSWFTAELSRGSGSDMAEAGRELGRFDSRGWIGGLRPAGRRGRHHRGHRGASARPVRAGGGAVGHGVRGRLRPRRGDDPRRGVRRRAPASARVGERPGSCGGRSMISRYALDLAVTGGSTAELGVGDESVRPRFRGSTHKYAFFASLIAGAVLVIAAPNGQGWPGGGDLRAVGLGAVRHERALPPGHLEALGAPLDAPARPLDDLRADRGHLHAACLADPPRHARARGAGGGVGRGAGRCSAEAGLDRRPEVADLGRLPGARLGGRRHDPADALARRGRRRGAGRDRRTALHGRAR